MQDSTKLHKFNIICHKNYCIYNKYDIILLYDRSENMGNLEMPKHGWEGISNGGEIYGNSNKNLSDSDILLDEVYKEWLKFGGLEHNSKNYKQYLEDMKEVAKKTEELPSMEEIKARQAKRLEAKNDEEYIKKTEEYINDLFAELDAIEDNSVEERRSFRR